MPRLWPDGRVACSLAPVLSAEVYARLVADQVASRQPGSFVTREHGMLMVYGSMGTYFLLGRNGEVLVDRDDGVLHPADPEEREFTYVQAARRYPELRHLAPERPPSAQTCQACGGSGEISLNGGRNMLGCLTCNTRGWTAQP
jgi:hypothetical protein